MTIKATIVRRSTTEANVSARAVWYDILVNGEYLTHRADICDALEVRDALNSGEKTPAAYA